MTVDGCAPAALSLWWHISNYWNSYYTAWGSDYAMYNVRYGVFGDARESEIRGCAKSNHTCAHIRIECHDTATDSMIMGIADINTQTQTVFVL